MRLEVNESVDSTFEGFLDDCGGCHIRLKVIKTGRAFDKSLGAPTWHGDKSCATL